MVASHIEQTIPENQKAVGDCFMTIGCQDTGVMQLMGEHQAEWRKRPRWEEGLRRISGWVFLLPLRLLTDSAILMPMKRVTEKRITVAKKAIAYIVLYFLIVNTFVCIERMSVNLFHAAKVGPFQHVRKFFLHFLMEM